MSEDLRFEDSSIRVLMRILVCIVLLERYDSNNKSSKKILQSDGYLLCRLNSTEDTNHGAGQWVMLKKIITLQIGSRGKKTVCKIFFARFSFAAYKLLLKHIFSEKRLLFFYFRILHVSPYPMLFELLLRI